MNWRKLLVVAGRVLVIAISLWFMYDSTILALDYEERKYLNIGQGVTE